MTDLAVIILVGREELHIRRCLEKISALEPRQVIVVESQTGDRTHEIAKETGRRLKFEVRSLKFEVSSSKFDVSSSKFEVRSPKFDVSSLKADSNSSTSNIKLQTVFHAWPGTQAKQFNWAVDNLPIEASWVLRLDADEYLTPETIERLKSYLSTSNFEHQTSNSPVYGLTLELRRRFCGGEISHATNGIRQVRIFRRGHGRYDEGLMDERLIISAEEFSTTIVQPSTSNLQPSLVEDFDGAFYDDSLMPMTEWKAKHRKYAKREAAQAIESLRTGVWTDPRKAAYYRLPKFLRAFAYFGVRYFLKGGFLDGYAGWMWNFWQGLWYRCLVDLEMARMGK